MFFPSVRRSPGIGQHHGPMRRKRTRACCHCREEFVPDRRNRDRQRYCGRKECRAASKAASQRRWLNKPENRNYFRGEHHTERVRKWRQKHPGYWKSSRKKSTSAPKEESSTQDVDNQQFKSSRDLVTEDQPLQDLSGAQLVVLVGLISMITGSTLQDHIAEILRRLEDRGRDVLGMGLGTERERTTSYDYQTPDSTGPDP